MPDAEGWSQVAVADLPPVAVLEPITSGAGSVAAGTDFRLTSLDGRDPAELATALVATPALTFEVVSTTGDTAVVRPRGGLEPGTHYEIALGREDGTAEAAWSMTAAGPLQVTDTVPGNATTKVPRDTAIEITFDQLGVTADGLAGHFTILPEIRGRFEAVGRSIAFLPDRPLAKGTLYTVTIGKGLPLPGTGQELEQDVVLRFETAAKATSDMSAHFARTVVEAPTDGRARITVAFDDVGNRRVPRTLDLTVHRVPDLEAAVAAWKAIANAPEWTRVSTAEPVPTTGLERVYAGSVPLAKFGDGSRARWFVLPRRLPAGWYVVTERWAGVPRQVLLQVSDLAPFAMVATDRTAVWVNDVRTGSTVARAAVSLGGHDLGRTDRRGLLVADTPRRVASGGGGADVLLVVRHGGQTVFHATGLGGGEMAAPGEEGWDGGWYGGAGYEEDWGYAGEATADDAWWRLFSTDREIYRPTDTLNAWGMARSRDTGTAPSEIVVRLRAYGGPALPVVASARQAPDENGAFALSLPFRDLPDDTYSLELVADGDSIGETVIEVGPIDKPAWQLNVESDRRAVISGQRVTVTGEATFYEGTPVAGARIDLDVWVDEGTELEARRVTDAFGLIRYAPTLWAGEACQPCWASIEAIPHVQEAAYIEGSVYIDVFAASAVVDAEGLLTGSRLKLAGKVSDVDLRRYERAAPDEEVDARGAGRAGARVRVQVVEHWSVRRQTGTRYDAIEKKVVPVYKTTYKQRTIADRSATTGRDGTWALALDVVGGRRSYEIRAWYEDEQGRTTRTTAWANEPDDEDEYDDGAMPRLVDATAGTGDDESDIGTYRVGEAVRVRFTGGIAQPEVERYLYAVSQRGLRYVTAGDTPTFRTTFEERWLPGVYLTGVRFTGTGYETAVNSYLSTADLDDRALKVRVTADRDRYAPGDTATISIRTTGPGGAPVPASVYVKAVDEKLYAIGAAREDDPLSELYAMVGDGLLATVVSHVPPESGCGDCSEGGDTTGGGGPERADFRDWLVATLVTTDRRGRATLEVPLSDDLTSWRVTASGVDHSLHAGQGSASLEVGLPFFVEATLKDEYLAADRPILRVRGFGSALRSRDHVRFTVSSETLGLEPVTVRSDAFGSAEVRLPRLSVGEHSVRIEADAGKGRSDVLVRTFRVVETRAVRRATSWSLLEGPASVDASTGRAFTWLTLVDAGRGRVIPLLQSLAWAGGVRSDQQLASALARRVLAGDLGLDTGPSTDEGDIGAFRRNKGLALVAHGSAQLEVTALAAMAADPQFGRGAFREELEAVAFDASQRRERRLVALAGLAGLGEPVAGEVRAAAAMPDLSVEEQVSLALAALYAGDEALAGRLEQAVLDAHGRARGAWLRVDAGGAEADAVQTARLAIVSASLGRPFAADMDAWLEANPPRTTVVDLERALAARGWVRRVTGPQAVAALWVDGSRREITIRGGRPVVVQLTPAQAASARLEPVAGDVLLVTQRDVPLDADGLTEPAGVLLTRTVTPGEVIGPTDTVIVTLTVTLPPDARREPWTVVDWAPSGLSPMAGGDWRRVQAPDSVVGQRVAFHVGDSAKKGVWTLRYVARVVSPGRYRWEPAVLQSDVNPDEGLLVAASEVRILGLDEVAPTPAASPAPSPASTPEPQPEPTPAFEPTPGLTPGPTSSPPPAPTPIGTPPPGSPVP